MMSEVYRRGGKLFRYDFENALVLWVAKATEDEKKQEAEWIAKWGNPLWGIDKDGYLEVQSIGLSESNWTNKELRDSYLDLWIDELEEESAHLAAQYLMYG